VELKSARQQVHEPAAARARERTEAVDAQQPVAEVELPLQAVAAAEPQQQAVEWVVEQQEPHAEVERLAVQAAQPARVSPREPVAEAPRQPRAVEEEAEAPQPVKAGAQPLAVA